MGSAHHRRMSHENPGLRRSAGWRNLFLLLLLSNLVLWFSGCTERYGESIRGTAPVVKVAEALADPSMEKKPVILEGTILTQCRASGCWFFLKDSTGYVLVDLAPRNFKIPPSMGKKARVEGLITVEKGQVKIQARGVEIS